MFLKLHTLVKSVEKLNITISAGADGMMKVCVVPCIGAGKEAALAQPLVLRATPEELDAGFVDAINQYQSARTSLADQVAATTVIIDSAKAIQESKAVKAVKGKSVNPTPKANVNKPVGDDGEDDDEGNNDDDDDDSIKSTPPEIKTITPAQSGTDLSSLI